MNDPLFTSGADYLHKNITELFTTAHSDLLRKLLDKAFTSGKLQCAEFFHGKSLYQLKCVLFNPQQAICIITNNTRHRKVLLELEEHNMQTLADNYVDWVWSFDTNFTLVTANKAFLDARHRINSKSLALGDSIFTGVDDSGYKKWMPVYERALKGETIFFEEKRNNLGREYYVEIYLSPVYDAQNVVIGCLGITRDITERKNAQLAAAGYAAKLEEFAFKTSHDLRRPVANIMGIAGLIRNKYLDDDEKEKGINDIILCINELDGVVISLVELMEHYKK